MILCYRLIALLKFIREDTINTYGCLLLDRKVEQVTEEVHALRISLDKFGSREQRRAAEKQEREELLSRADTGRLAKQEMDTEAQVGSLACS